MSSYQGGSSVVVSAVVVAAVVVIAVIAVAREEGSP